MTSVCRVGQRARRLRARVNLGVSLAENGKSTALLWQVAGVLALVYAGAVVFQWALRPLMGYSLSVSLFTITPFIPIGLAVAGGVSALQRKTAIAPWLIIAAFAVNWIGGAVGLLRALSPYEYMGDPQMSVIMTSSIFGLIGGVALLAAVVVAVIALIKDRQAAAPLAAPVAAPAASAGLAMPDATGAIPAGWYRDPDGKPSERYWDGTAWTEQTRPLTVMTAQSIAAPGKVLVDQFGQPVSDSSRLVAVLLCFFLGVLGIHRFYVGKIGTGIAQIFTLGGLGVWALIDFILILAGAFKDIQGRRLINW